MVALVSFLALAQQTTPLKDYIPRGIGVVSIETAAQARTMEFGMEGAGAFGVRLTVRGNSPLWNSGVTSDDVVVRLNDKYFTDLNPSASQIFATELSTFTGAGKEVSMALERDQEGMKDMFFVVNIKPTDNLADFTNMGGGSTKINPNAKPLSNLTAGGIGLTKMLPVMDSAGRIKVKILPGSPAWQAGLRDDDQIVSYNDVDVTSGEAARYSIVKFREALIKAKMDEEVNLVIVRPSAPPDKRFSLSVKKRVGLVDRQYGTEI
ncbi:MAG: PDZ domain-containing protein [Armatimonadota bacterium]